MIEEAHRSGDHEASVLIHGRVYMLDFNMLQQINEDTGNHRPVRRQKNEKETSMMTIDCPVRVFAPATMRFSFDVKTGQTPSSGLNILNYLLKTTYFIIFMKIVFCKMLKPLFLNCNILHDDRIFHLPRNEYLYLLKF